jgi:hypothetical protein
MIIRSHPTDPFRSTPETPVHDHLLAVPTGRQTDRLHKRSAFAFAIPRHTSIDMPRVETERAVVAMASAADRRANECAAVSEFKRLPALSNLAGMMVR